MSDFIPTEKGVPIREASTANLLLSSQDRFDYSPVSSSTSPGVFTIQKNQAILNGFFTRIAPAEINLQWAVPNVYDISGGGNPLITSVYTDARLRVDVSGGSVTTVTVPYGIYTVASAIDTIVARMNATVTGTTFSVTQAGSAISITGTNKWRFKATTGFNALSLQLGFGVGVGVSGGYALSQTTYNSQTTNGYSPQGTPFNMRPQASLLNLQYIDFVSQQLTYNQDLKDASTSQENRDIIFRWYLSSNNSTSSVSFDKYGFPIYPTYGFFWERRPIAFPKQIKWSPNQPIGQIQFEVYATDINNNTFLLTTDGYEWMMSLLISEV
jgi:hypothetical protein